MLDTHAYRHLTPAQRAAVARIGFALEQPGAVVLLCGPGGVGKTTLLAAIEAGLRQQSRTLLRCDVDDEGEIRQPRGGTSAPQVLLVDDAHRTVAERLSRIVDGCHGGGGPDRVVLAGEGRLFTLVSRDARLEQAVRLRAVLPPFTLDESTRLMEPVLRAAHAEADRAAVARCVHEIAAGIPAVVRRLADTVAVFAEAHPDHVLVADDVETMHRRLAANAA